MGTMAHSYVESFPTERDAFLAFASDLPERAVFLVDTYDTLQGVRRAAEVIGELGLEGNAGIRLDSGDLVALSTQARAVLDEAGMTRVRIFVSGGLDEHDLAALVAAGAPVDAAGIGTRLAVSADAPYLDTVYKLVAYDGEPVLKLSSGKATLPGAKQVFRGAGLVDLLALRHEAVPSDMEPLLECVMVGGRRLVPTGPVEGPVADPVEGPVEGPVAVLQAAKRRFEVDLAAVPASTRALVDPKAPSVSYSAALKQLTAEARARHRLSES